LAVKKSVFVAYYFRAGITLTNSDCRGEAWVYASLSTKFVFKMSVLPSPAFTLARIRMIVIRNYLLPVTRYVGFI
jgi:hypothetical protein